MHRSRFPIGRCRSQRRSRLPTFSVPVPVRSRCLGSRFPFPCVLLCSWCVHICSRGLSFISRAFLTLPGTPFTLRLLHSHFSDSTPFCWLLGLLVLQPPLQSWGGEVSLPHHFRPCHCFVVLAFFKSHKSDNVSLLRLLGFMYELLNCARLLGSLFLHLIHILFSVVAPLVVGSATLFTLSLMPRSIYFFGS